MNYQQKLAKVVDFIGQHLDDEDITLERLSDIFCISKFHFHRLFTAFSGLSLQQYIRWLRLKRAARQLLIDKKEPIINIAINAGFDSHEAFSRIFKKICGLSPSQYRKTPGYCYWDQLPYSLPKHGTKPMNIEIHTKEKRRLAIVEHRGDPQLISDSVNRLISWAQAQPVNIKPSAGDAFAFAYDDPYTTPAAEFRLDLGITIPESLKLDQNVIEKYLPAGRYAVTMHKGSRTQIGETVYSLYREWLPQSNEQLGDLPCIFCYYNFEHEVAETALLTECWLLLK